MVVLLLELIEESDIAAQKMTDVVDAVAHHNQSVQAEAKGKA